MEVTLQETSKATSDRAQLVVSNTALLADMKAEYEVKVELMEERLREAVGRAESFERELEQCKAENGEDAYIRWLVIEMEAAGSVRRRGGSLGRFTMGK